MHIMFVVVIIFVVLVGVVVVWYLVRHRVW